MTREEIQRNIDHYAAVAEAHRRVSGDMDFHVGFYRGKSAAWIDIWNKLYPEEDRAYPLNKEEYEKDVQFQLEIIKNTKEI